MDLTLFGHSLSAVLCGEFAEAERTGCELQHCHRNRF